MSTSAQEVLNALHDAYGLSDSDLGEALGVSREHINRLRSGAKQASERLEDMAWTIYDKLSTPRAARACSVEIEPDETGLILGFTKKEIIIAGVVVLALALGAIWLWVRAHPKEEKGVFSLSV